MLKDLLKANLSEETYAKVAEELKDKDLKVIPKARFDEVNTAKKTAEKTIKDLNTKLDGYSDYEDIKTKNSELTTQLEGYSDYDEMKGKIETLTADTHKAKLISLGYDPELVGFALERIDTNDFDESAKKFIEENPKFKSENFQQQNSQFNLNGSTHKNIDEMSDKEYIAFRKEHKADGTKK